MTLSAEFHDENKQQSRQRSFVCMKISMGPAMRSCSQFDLVIMDCSQSLYNRSELDSHRRSEGTLSLKHSHAHVQLDKSCPALCRSGAIIVRLVQLHLK